MLGFRHHDGSNQLGDLHPGAYSDTTGYRAVNTPATIVDPNRWQPLFVVNASGDVTTQVYTTPHWGRVIPFALASGSALRPVPPALYPSSDYAKQAADLVALSAGLTDFQKVTAEYFADGPSSEFPPGHWALFAQFVSRRDNHSLDDDVKMFFALGNALLDAGICAWDAKLAYDSVRPVTAIHFLYAGQTILAWGGPGQGTKPIRGEFWRPYQLATVVTPPFPEYFSGHSVFSAAGAEVLKSFTGSDALRGVGDDRARELHRRAGSGSGRGPHALVPHLLERGGRRRDVPPLGRHPFRAGRPHRPVARPRDRRAGLEEGEELLRRNGVRTRSHAAATPASGAAIPQRTAKR